MSNFSARASSRIVRANSASLIKLAASLRWSEVMLADLGLQPVTASKLSKLPIKTTILNIPAERQFRRDASITRPAEPERTNSE